MNLLLGHEAPWLQAWHRRCINDVRRYSMTFIVVGLIVFLILIVFRKYKTLTSVIITIAGIAGATTVVLIEGLAVLSGHSTIHFFYTGIGSSEFYHLMAVWYAMDLLCSAIIIRRFLEYKKINRGPK
jgi:hypothetical protein